MLPKAINDLSRQSAPIAEELMEAAARVIRSGWFVLGPEVKAFEREFADYCGAAHCVSLANGTDALEIGLRALGVIPGSRVITVANAGAYSSCAIRAIGAEPVYVDVDDRDMSMSVEALRSMDVRGCAAIIATHLYGRLAPIEAITAIAAEAGVPVLEDCAHAHGASRNGRLAGSFGAAASFSFYPTKNLGALGDAGALVTGNADVAQRAASLRQYGWTSKYFAVLPGGRNSRLDEIQAAFLRVKLRYVDRWNQGRRVVARRYLERIRNPHVRLPDGIDDGCVANLFIVRVPAQRDAMAAFLKSEGVAVDVHYPIPDYRQPAVGGCSATALPVTEACCASVLTLPCFAEMSEAEVDAIAERVNRWKP